MAAIKKSNAKKAAVKKAAAEKKEKTALKKATKKNSLKPEKEVDFRRVRIIIAGMVEKSAELICLKVLEVAKTGQLAPAKYMFEAVGLFPATEREARARPENSLAFTLLKRMGLPTEPMADDDEPPIDTPGISKPLAAKPETEDEQRSEKVEAGDDEGTEEISDQES
jgi:hypothetical protein